MRWLLPIVIAGCVLTLAPSAARAEDTIALCSSGTIVLGSFTQHVLELRRAHRSTPKEIDNLIAAERAGGPDFFSSQIVIERAQSGSSDFDLNLFQGFSDPQAKYQSVEKWHCKSDDYPLAYFVGFKVTEIGDGAIFVSRENGTVNVISLKKLDPELDKHMSVKDFHSRATLCEDIASGCSKGIFYGRY
jgi:hypothetical protein